MERFAECPASDSDSPISVDQATENLLLNRKYYQAGTVTMSDLPDAQTLYQQSKDNCIDAYAKYRIKVLEYKQTTEHYTFNK